MTRDSQKLQILRYLAQGKTLTPIQALARFSCLTLSQRCTELRKEGWPVQSELVNVGGKHVARYWLEGARAA